MNIDEIRARAEAATPVFIINGSMSTANMDFLSNAKADVLALLDALEAKEQEISRLNCVHTAARVTIDGLNAIIKDQNEQLTAAAEDITQMANCKLLGDCTFCKHRLSVPDMRYKPCKGCERPNRSKSNFEWRGKERSNGR